MKFGPVPIDAAEGAIAAHSVPLREGRIRKGQTIDAESVHRLRAAGIETLIVACLDADDVGEDAAAEALGAALLTDGLRMTAPATGRVNLYAKAPGVFVPSPGAVLALNSIDPAITLATLPSLARVAAGTMVGTVKIIAYGVGTASLDRAVAAAAEALRLARPQYSDATLIETSIGAAPPPDKGRRAMAARLDRLGLSLTARVVVPHCTDALADAIAEAPGEAIFVLTASATSDLHDVAPEALRRAGGTVARFGMPVDPGNLLFHGDFGDRPVIGLPGCARSPALNGADWVLERRLCGLELRDADIAAMGLGGLLKESPARGRPREG